MRILTVLALLLTATRAVGQSPDSVSIDGGGLPLLGGMAEDEARLGQLIGEVGTDGFLHRSLSTRLPRPDASGPSIAALDPVFESVWNSELPFSLNEGSLWAGRGFNALLTAGVRLTTGPLDVVLAPQFSYAQNREFRILSPRDPQRSQFASPWHIRDQSADLPLRFGDTPRAILHPGQSSVTIRAGRARFGAAVENEWWGPGIRNAIVMSSNAEGIPRLFLGTDGPLETAVGALEGQWILGTLTESLHFDRDPENDLRSLNGFVATFRPTPEPDLTLGVTRVVYGSVADRWDVAGHALDALTWWKRQPVPPDSTIQDPAALEEARARVPTAYDREQMFALFGRWIFPVDGLELYGEWARVELPRSLTDLLSQPNHSQGYTLGLQWATPVRAGSIFRLQGEATYLEESSTFNNRPVPGFYVSGAVPQGYTQRGRSIGAAIGPGASSQWLASDYIARDWRLGLSLGRIRWENDVYYRGRDRSEVGHDVTVFAGLRAGATVLGTRLLAELIPSYRYNYLFQNPALEPGGRYAIDMTNATFRLTVMPAH